MWNEKVKKIGNFSNTVLKFYDGKNTFCPFRRKKCDSFNITYFSWGFLYPGHQIASADRSADPSRTDAQFQSKEQQI